MWLDFQLFFFLLTGYYSDLKYKIKIIYIHIRKLKHGMYVVKKITAEDNLHLSAGHTDFDAAQDTVGFWGFEGTLMSRVHVLIHEHPPGGLFSRPFSPIF